MATETKIEWCHHSFSGWIDCSEVAGHPGCAHCYARDFMDRRLKKVKWGPHGTRMKTSDANWKKPLLWNRRAKDDGERRRVFAFPDADVFEDWQGPIHNHHGDRLVINGSGAIFHVTENWQPCYQERLMTLDDVRRELFTLIDATPHLDWLLLTKRPENIRRMWPDVICDSNNCFFDEADQKRRGLTHAGPHKSKLIRGNYPRSNIWLGTSISDQETADRNIPLLLECRDLAPVLFLSAEPLLGPVDLDKFSCGACGAVHRRSASVKATRSDCPTCRHSDEFTSPENIYWLGRSPSPLSKCDGIDWCIVGSESGPKRRPMQLDWAQQLVKQCRAADVPAFVKQLPINGRVSHEPAEWPEDLRVREFPQVERSVSA